MIRFYLLILLAFTSSKSFAKNNDQQTIIDNIHAMWSAIEHQNLSKYLNYIHDDYSVFGENDVYLHEGKDKEAVDIGEFIKRAKGVRTFMHQPKVTINGNTALITYYWSDAGEINGNRYTSRGKSTRIFVKEDDRRLCLHSHFTEIP